MSVYESSVTNPKKQLEFYKQLSEQLQQENQQLKNQLKEKHDGFMASVDESCELAEENQKYKEVIDRLKSIVNDNNVSITRLELGLGILNIKNNLLVILNEVDK